MTIGEKIKALRTQRGLSKAKLAVMADLHRRDIVTHEKGAFNPNIDSLRRYAQAFGITLAALFEDVT